jgi:hypothetical protein
MSFAGLNIPDELLELTKMNAVTYQHEYADAAFNKVLLFLGLSSSNTQVQKKKGCLFSLKYKGCLVSITLVTLVCLMLNPLKETGFVKVDTRKRIEVKQKVAAEKTVSQKGTEKSTEELLMAQREKEKELKRMDEERMRLELIKREKEEAEALARPKPELLEGQRRLLEEQREHGQTKQEKLIVAEETIIGCWGTGNDSLEYIYDFGKSGVERTMLTNGEIVKKDIGMFEIDEDSIIFVWSQRKQTAKFDLNGSVMTITYKDGKKIRLTRY